MVAEANVDGGFDGASVEAAETLWACLPQVRKWTSLATHEKALVIHTLARHRIQSEGRTGAGEALAAEIKAHVDRYTVYDDARRIYSTAQLETAIRLALSQSTAGCPHEAWEDRGGNKCCVDCGLWFDDAEQSTAGEDGA